MGVNKQILWSLFFYCTSNYANNMFKIILGNKNNRRRRTVRIFFYHLLCHNFINILIIIVWDFLCFCNSIYLGFVKKNYNLKGKCSPKFMCWKNSFNIVIKWWFKCNNNTSMDQSINTRKNRSMFSKNVHKYFKLRYFFFGKIIFG